jgi:Ca-activated chloride channel family protein
VIDTSGSMEGAKLERAKQALASFIDQIQGDRDQIALVEFGSGTKNFTPLTPVSAGNRQQLQSTVQQMEASGGTALIDAVYAAADDLAQRGASDAINAIVVMTDGKENQSYYDLAALRALLRSTQPAPVVFTIAFGDDADEEMLNEMARIGSGQFRRATEIDIQELYKIISTYF